ncbi:hypothetical protein HDV00_007953 [Rhizophlyctis rosea]|nr:hypothetical protein HDV00_007953 [Rhizophlyctis rosea]
MKFTLAATTAFAVLALSAEVDAQCSTRRSWTQLSGAEKTRYLAAVQALKNKPRSNNLPADYNNPQNLGYDDLVKLHWDYMRISHSTPLFFPWHRKYLWTWSQALKSVDPGVDVVYWSWQLDSQAPERADVFNPAYFGTDGVGPNHCLQDGVMAHWSVSYPGTNVRKFPTTCVTRCMNPTSFVTPEYLTNLINTYPDYNSYHLKFESFPHAQVHNQIGGTCDFSTMYSPNDPIFFLHHANVDKQWARFQNHCPSKKTDYGGAGNAQPSDVMQPWGVTVQSVLDTTTTTNCYTYSQDASDQTLDASKCPTTPTVGSGGVNGTATNTAAPPSATDPGSALPQGEPGWFNFALNSLVGTFQGTFNTSGANNATAGQQKKAVASVSTPKAATTTRKARRAINLDVAGLNVNIDIGETATAPAGTSTKYIRLAVPTSGPLIDLNAPDAPNVEVGTETVSATESASTTKAEPTATSVYTPPPLPTTYVPSPTRLVTPPPPKDRSDKIHCRQPDNIPSSWIKMMGYDEKLVRQLEYDYKYFVDDQNDRGIISRGSLKYWKENAPTNAKEYGDSYDKVTSLPTGEDKSVYDSFYNATVVHKVVVKKPAAKPTTTYKKPVIVVTTTTTTYQKAATTTKPVVVKQSPEETQAEAIETQTASVGGEYVKGSEYVKGTDTAVYETPAPTATAPGYAKAPAKGKCH